MNVTKRRPFATIFPPLLISALVLLLYAVQPGPIDRLEGLFLRLLRRIPSAPPSAHYASLIVFDDDRDIGVLVRLISLIEKGYPCAVAIDAPLPAIERASEEEIERLAGVMESFGNVLLSYRLCSTSECSPRRLEELRGARIDYVTNPWGSVRITGIPAENGAEDVSGILLRSAAGSGFSNVQAGGDAASGSVPLVLRAGGGFYRSVITSIVGCCLHSERAVLRMSGRTVSGLQLGGLFVATGPRGDLVLRRRPEGGRTPSCSAGEILDGSFAPEKFKGKAVIITAERGDGPHAPGPAQVHAAAVDEILGARYLRRSPETRLAIILLIAVFPIALSLAAPFMGAIRFSIFALGALLFTFGLSACLFIFRSEIMDPACPVLGVLAAWVWNLRITTGGKS